MANAVNPASAEPRSPGRERSQSHGLAAGSIVAGRYVVAEPLGEGGTSSVYRVRDVSTDRDLAFKRLADAAANDAEQARRFEREYYTLRQLAHPSIIEVYDFGIDAGAPFYTMELLAGADLTAGAPLEWDQALAVLLPVVSSLAVIHSRRLVHRDVSATNVRLTDAGGAKLLDFGAMTEMGVARQLVGTIAYVPPEAVNQQPLDQRVDLYALGALLYYLLTGEDAYPAQTFPELRRLWQMPLPSARELNESVPEALSLLVARLLALEPTARPNSAAEVMERLSAIGGLPLDESAAVRQAYLTTPQLVGREAELKRARQHILAARQGHGGVLLIRGAAGVGRSRVLDACVLEAKLAGSIVLRADAADGSDFSVSRALVDQLEQAVPEALRLVQPELAALADRSEAHAVRPQLQAALQQHLLAAADRYSLVLAIDDLHLIDEPSAALLALLAAQTSQHRLAISVTLCSDALARSPKAAALIGAEAALLDLTPLTAAHAEQLLCSVFGDVPGVRLLSARLHTLSEGNPRALMDLGQHLVSQGLVRYEGGAWIMPERFDANVLPKRVLQTLQARLDGLGADGRLLADTLALCRDVDFSHEEYVALADLQTSTRLHAALDELISARVLRSAGGRYAFQQDAWVELLRAGMSAQRAAPLHRRLAAVLAQRGDEPLLVAMLLMAAGDTEQALAAIVVLSNRWIDRDQSAMQNHRYVQMTMSADFTQTLQAGLSLFDQHSRPRHERHAVQLALLYAAVHGRLDMMRRYLPGTIAQLVIDSGLQDFMQLDASLEHGLRLRRALGVAKARYEAASEQERVFAPAAAIKHLVRLVHSVAALAAAKLDSQLLDALPELAPLEPVSPALAIARQNVEAVRFMISGRYLAAIAVYRRMIARLDDPDLAGHEPTLHKYVRLAFVYAMGHTEAGLGLDAALESAAQLESDPLHELNALRVRSNYYLTRGAARQAEACRRQLELLQIQNAPPQFFEGHEVARYLPSYAAADDLLNVKRALDTIDNLAVQCPGWLPVRHYAAGEYARIRGDNATALACFARALDLTEPAGHDVWPHAAGQYLVALLAAGRAPEAHAVGAAWTQAWERYELVGSVGVAFAAVEAALGQHEAALARLDVIIARWKAQGIRGVELGRAYELAARSAQATQQAARFDAYAALCGEEYTYGQTPAFITKYQRLYDDRGSRS
jgi:hypothetical protein